MTQRELGKIYDDLKVEDTIFKIMHKGEPRYMPITWRKHLGYVGTLRADTKEGKKRNLHHNIWIYEANDFEFKYKEEGKTITEIKNGYYYTDEGTVRVDIELNGI